MFVVIISVYLSIGITWLIADMREPFTNQPQYIREGKFFNKILHIFTWPNLLLDFRYFIRELIKFNNLIILIIVFLIIYFLLGKFFLIVLST